MIRVLKPFSMNAILLQIADLRGRAEFVHPTGRAEGRHVIFEVIAGLNRDGQTVMLRRAERARRLSYADRGACSTAAA
jgi:hypothetical protein